MRIKYLLIFGVLITYIPIISADGFLKSKRNGIWDFANETHQDCVINYRNNTQKMILRVGFNLTDTTTEAVWIFPVPSRPEKTDIDLKEQFPFVSGANLSDIVYRKYSKTIRLYLTSQLYPLIVTEVDQYPASGGCPARVLWVEPIVSVHGADQPAF